MDGCLVCNTGPLIALAIIQKLNILKALFSEVVIPEAVHYEILEGGVSCAGIASYRKESWIQVRPTSKDVDPLLDTVLDLGEASVIQLATECGADFVLIDEKKGRKVAREIYDLRVVGSARILVEAKQRGIIENVSDLIKGMRDGGYWIHNDIVTFALKEASEL